MKRHTTFTYFLTIVFSVVAACAVAQETRADEMRLQQADKRLSPPQPTMTERAINKLEKWGLGGPPRGLYPWFGSIFPGGGFAGGVGVRQPFGDHSAVTVRAGYSIDSCVIAATDVALFTVASGRAALSASAQYIDAPRVAFYGVGNDTSKGDLTHYGYSPTRVGGRFDFDVSRRLKAGGEISYIGAETSLTASPFTFIKTTARASFDYRSRLGYAGSGGLYRLQLEDFSDRDGGSYSFRSVEADALQLIPLLRANWVVALRGAATLTDATTGADVPFFLMPSIGGGSSVRGYPDFRFIDRNRVVMNAELRWTPARFLDMALFYDAGKVEARARDLGVRDLKTAFGFGLRVIGLKGYALRIEAARSHEYPFRLIVGAGGAL